MTTKLVSGMLPQANELLTLLFSFLPTPDVIHKFVRDLYSKRFPELESLVHTPLEYVRTVQVKGGWKAKRGLTGENPVKYQFCFCSFWGMT